MYVSGDLAWEVRYVTIGSKINFIFSLLYPNTKLGFFPFPILLLLLLVLTWKCCHLKVLHLAALETCLVIVVRAAVSMVVLHCRLFVIESSWRWCEQRSRRRISGGDFGVVQHPSECYMTMPPHWLAPGIQQRV